MSQEEDRLVPQEEQPPQFEEGVLPPLISQPEETWTRAEPSPSPKGELPEAEAPLEVEALPEEETSPEELPKAEAPEVEALSEAETSPEELPEAEAPEVEALPEAETSPEELSEAEAPEVEALPEAEAPEVEALPEAEAPKEELPDQQAEEEELFQRPRSLKDLKPGMTLEGKVTSVAIYGAFVDIGVGREGLVHLSQLSDRPVSSPTEVVQIGDMVTVRILDVDLRNKRINLTMREHVEPEIDEEKLEVLTPGTILEGTITSMTRFGAFIDIGIGRDGLVPRSQLPSRRGQAAEPPQVGDQVQVRVLDVDRKSSRIRLSMRDIFDPDQLAALESGKIVRGRIASLAPFGAFVDLGVGKDGLIHISTMGEGNVRHPREIVEVGQEVEVRILDVDPDTQRISLSMQLEEEEGEVDWTPEPEKEEELPVEPTLENLASYFNTMRTEPQERTSRRADRGEKERRAVREALRRTLEGMRQDQEDD